MPRVEVDPRYPGTAIRRAFLIEALANLGVLPAITHPRWVLFYLLAHPALINPASVLLLRLFSGLVLGCLVIPLLLARRNTRAAIDSRRGVYYLLAGGEMVLIPMLIADQRSSAPALGPLAALGALGSLVPPLLWRVYMLFVRPEMMGRYKEKRE